jgi:hypothetical protein
MALATGTEAPSKAIGQLQLDADSRRRFARSTLVLTLVIVATLTVAITMLAVRLHVGVPRADSTQIADVAAAPAGTGWCTRSSRPPARCSSWRPRAHRSRPGRG